MLMAFISFWRTHLAIDDSAVGCPQKVAMRPSKISNVCSLPVVALCWSVLRMIISCSLLRASARLAWVVAQLLNGNLLMPAIAAEHPLTAVLAWANVDKECS